MILLSLSRHVAPHGGLDVLVRATIGGARPPRKSCHFGGADGRGVVYMSAAHTFVDLDVPPGNYQVRIVGRGFINYGWPGSTTPGDTWRIQFWPSKDVIEPKRIAHWVGFDRG